MKILIKAFLISIIGVFIIDYFAHLLFSTPMETVSYFIIKAIFYFIFSIIFLYFFDQEKIWFIKVLVAGIIVALLFWSYYNVLPVIMENIFNIEYYPLGIALSWLTFLKMGFLGTGIAFWIVHTLAFITGYYLSNFILIQYDGINK